MSNKQKLIDSYDVEVVGGVVVLQDDFVGLEGGDLYARQQTHQHPGALHVDCGKAGHERRVSNIASWTLTCFEQVDVLYQVAVNVLQQVEPKLGGDFVEQELLVKDLEASQLDESRGAATTHRPLPLVHAMLSHPL